MDQFGRVKRHRHAVVIADDTADANDVVLAVVVHVGNAELMAFGIVVIRRRLIEPTLCQHAVAIIPRDGQALKRSSADAIFARENHAGMNAVEIGDAGVTIQRSINNVGIGNGGLGLLRSGQSIHDGKELNIRTGPAGLHHAVSENGAVGRTHNHLRLAVAVEVVNRHVVLVSDADGRRAGFINNRAAARGVHAVRAHVHLPQERAVAFVRLEILFHVRGERQAVHQIIVFAVAVKIAEPTKLHIVRRIRATDDRLQRNRNVLAHG